MNEYISQAPKVHAPYIRVQECMSLFKCLCVRVCVCVQFELQNIKRKWEIFITIFFLCSSLIASLWLSFPGQNLKHNILFFYFFVRRKPNFIFIYFTTDKCQGRYIKGGGGCLLQQKFRGKF